MDLDSLNDSPRAHNHTPRTHDWDWANLCQHPLRDFETVKNSYELAMSHFKDFQDILYGKKCFVLQNPENKNLTWGSAANNLLSQSLQRKGPRVVGQSEDFRDPACPDWIKTVQGLKAGVFQSYESDEGGIVYRGDLKGCQVEISVTEMALLNTFSMENPSVPSIRDQRMELEIRRTFLESFQDLARRVKDSYTMILDSNTAMEQSCKDLELDIQVGTEIPKYRNNSKSNPHLENHHDGLAPNDEIVDLTQEDRQSPIIETQLFQANDVVAMEVAHSSADSLQQSEADMEHSLRSTPTQVVTKDENLTMSCPPSEVELASSDLHPATESLDTNRNPSTPRSQRSSTPISTKDRQIKRNEMEKRQAVPFVQDLLSQGLNFQQIRERYKVKFGIWRTAASLACYHSQNKHKHHLVFRISPSRLREIVCKDTRS
ncbi:hypothetical protein N7494_000281 [Penicillium frequentans]|uniref:Uncharacterized protein n=1 Tax=Penicillium frequentans TaxID=3151616 RepID=A0AAD6GJP6_9EURO|nr:hypothetical protein N7494_000281 [Penicillium glabrum]